MNNPEANARTRSSKRSQSSHTVYSCTVSTQEQDEQEIRALREERARDLIDIRHGLFASCTGGGGGSIGASPGRYQGDTDAIKNEIAVSSIVPTAVGEVAEGNDDSLSVIIWRQQCQFLMGGRRLSRILVQISRVSRQHEV